MSVDNKIYDVVVKITKTMANCFEHIDVDEKEINDILIDNKFGDLDFIDGKIIKQFGSELLRYLNTERKLNFDDILLINKNIGKDLNLENGKFADKNRKVVGKNNSYIEIKPVDKDLKRKEFGLVYRELNNKNVDKNQKTNLILSYFVNGVVEQWFFDGNKRTMLIACNKMLKDYGDCFLVNFDYKKFDEKLANVYESKYVLKEKIKENQKDLVFFLKENLTINKSFEIEK